MRHEVTRSKLERCRPGSIEQEVDMCENGDIRGDQILYEHGQKPLKYTGNPIAVDRLMDRTYDMDCAEVDREGDEMSGDEHSSGLQGGELEIEHQRHLTTGLPGDETEHENLWTVEDEVSDEDKDLPIIPLKRAAGGA
jgi:hypothetical protein